MHLSRSALQEVPREQGVVPGEGAAGQRLGAGRGGPGASEVLMMLRTEALNSGTVIVLSWTLLCCRVCCSVPGLPSLGTVSKHPLLWL